MINATFPSLKDYVTVYLGFNCKFYTRKNHYYVKIIVYGFDSLMDLHRLVQHYYPAARLVRKSQQALVFNLGSVFDMIAAPDQPIYTLPDYTF
jgi:hypothetical protein